MSKKLENEVAVVTGAASGIGKETAITLAKNGAYVACLDINKAGLIETQKTITDLKGNSIIYTVDISNEDAVQDAMNDLFEKTGKISILVNCAATILYNDIETCTVEQWNSVFNVNVLGYFIVLKAIAPYIKKSGGNIVQFSSSSAYSGSMFASPAYISSKSAISGLSKHIAKAWGPYNIRCNTLCPSLTQTELIKDEEGNYRRWDDNSKDVPLKRNAYPEDMAKVVLFLVSEDSFYVNGQTLHVNGGKYMYNT